MQTRTETRELQLGDFNKGEHGCGHGVAAQGVVAQGRTWQGETSALQPTAWAWRSRPPAPPVRCSTVRPLTPGDCCGLQATCSSWPS